MSKIKITDHTIYNMAWDVCEGVLNLEMVKYLDIQDDLKYQFIKKLIAPLRYITLLMETHEGLETEVGRILMAKSPDVIEGWDNVRMMLLREEKRRRIDDDEPAIDDVNDAVRLINSIRKHI